MDEYNRKRAGGTVTAPVTAPSSLVPLDASQAQLKIRNLRLGRATYRHHL
jgi:hypothetical protein